MKSKLIHHLSIILLLCQLLTSCYSYRSIQTSKEPTDTTLSSKIVTGETYRIILTSGEKKEMKVLKVDEKNLYGTFYTPNPNGKTFESPDTILPLDQVADVEKKRSEHLLTALALTVPSVILVIMAINFDGFGDSFRMTF